MPKIYHNHIPRTGGNFVSASLMQKMFKVGLNKYHIRHPDYQFKVLKKEEIQDVDVISGHFGLEPEILLGKENLSSITVLRDPVSRIVSHFTACIFTFEKNPLYNKNIENSKIFSIDEQLKIFKAWIRNSDDMLTKSNFQSRWLLNGLNNDLQTVTREEAEDENKLVLLTTRDGWGVGLKEPTYEKVLEKVNGMFCVGTTENIKGFFSNFDKKFYDAFNLVLPETFLDSSQYQLDTSKTIYNMISSEDIDIIKELNQIDLKLWEHVSNSYDNA
jgi:hypothetical protein